MIVSKVGEYIKLSGFSAEFPELIVSGTFESVLITGNINCCQQDCTDLVNTYSLALDTSVWKADLNNAVLLNNIIYTLHFKNVVSGTEYNIISTPIDLSYVENNCVSPSCTLQDFSGYFAPLFKTEIDNWFLNVTGIPSNVIITFDGNTLIIDNLPSEYPLLPTSIEYGPSVDPTEETYGFTPIGYSDTNSRVFLTANREALYIAPEFFGAANLKLVDGVYKFTTKWIMPDNAGFIEEQNCAFIDVTIKCKVASVLQNILRDASQKGSEKCSEIIHLLHYALINGSNCGCNCDELCEVYKGLVDLLNNIDPNIVNDCGC